MRDKNKGKSIQVIGRDSPAQNHKDTPDILSEVMEYFNNAWPALQSERLQALEDRRFVFIAGAQWEGAWGDLFSNSIQVEINKTAQGTNDILAQYKANRFSVDFRAANSSTENDAAETLNGMYLADKYLSKGQQAEDNAFTEGLSGGYGAWRLTNVYCDDEDEEENKQKIIWGTIVDADQNVFWDTNAKLYDKSDAGVCLVVSPVSKEAFINDYGAERLCSFPEGFIKPVYDWFAPDVIRVCEYYKIIEVKDTVYQLVNKLSGTKAKVYKSEDNYQAILKDYKTKGYTLNFKKDIKRKECRKWIMSGMELLSDEEGMLIAGGMIPVIPFYGMRCFIDNQERARGHVRLAKDPQRVYNVQISKLTETAALAPLERPIVSPEQIEGHEESWANANLNRAPYALLNMIVDPSTGQKVPSGPIGKIEPPQMSPVLAALIMQTDKDIKELTDSDDGAGQVKANVSADAMNIAATRTDDKAALYLDNMKQSVQRSGEIYQAMSADIYFEDNREMLVIEYDKSQKVIHKNVIINERSVDANNNQIIKNQIGKHQYNVISDVTEATNTKRDKTVKALTNASTLVMPTNPELGSIMMSYALINMDGEGMHDLISYVRADLIKKGVVKPTDEEANKLQEELAKQAEQPPAPEQQVLLAEAQRLNAETQHILAEIQTEIAKTRKTETDAIVNIANAAKIEAETGSTRINAMKETLTPSENVDKKQAPVNETPPKKPSFLDRFKNLVKR